MAKRDYKQELWLHLLSWAVAKNINIETEYKFHPTRKWRFDFAIPELKIAVEYEGQAYQCVKSRHTTIKGYRDDCEKYNEAVIHGWKVLRFTAEMITNGTAFRQIDDLMKVE